MSLILTREALANQIADDLETRNANSGLIEGAFDKQMPISGGVLEDYKEKLNTTTGTIDLSLGNVFSATPTANTTFTITNAGAGGHSFTLVITLGSTAWTLTFPNSVKWQDGMLPMTIASKTYIVTFVTIDSGTTWFGMSGGMF